MFRIKTNQKLELRFRLLSIKLLIFGFISLIFNQIQAFDINNCLGKQSFPATSNYNNYFQYGYSFKYSIDFGNTKSKSHGACNRLTLNAGLGYKFDWFAPVVNFELDFNSKGIGSRYFYTPKQNRKINVDLVSAVTFNYGFTNGQIDITKMHNNPLYYFRDFTNPALTNPFTYSLGTGVNWIIPLVKNYHKECQRVSFVNLNFNYFQISYFNDGGPVMELLGDKKDRYWTAGLFAGIYLPYKYKLNNLIVSWYKYTGYTENAFELTNLLDFHEVRYKDTGQKYFNSSQWNLSVSGLNNCLEFSYKFWNSHCWDIQHGIHFGIYNGYHYVYPRRVYRSFGVGVKGNGNKYLTSN